MVEYLERIKRLAQKFNMFKIHQVPRTENIKADALAILVSTIEGVKN